MTGAALTTVDATLAAVLAAHRPLGSEEPLLQVAGPFAASPAALADWARQAGAGQVCVFARAPSAPSAVCKHSRVLASRGLLTLRQGRSTTDRTMFDYMARRTPLPYAQARPSPSETPLQPEARLLLNALTRLADAGSPCLKNAELAAIIGVRSPELVSRLIARLIAANEIAMEFDPASLWRVIEILDSGARTAPHPEVAA